ncbi:hypothetical protein MC885_002113, partial [Smutsia gigantea]
MERQRVALLGLLWVRGCWVRALQVEQSPSALSLREGAGSAPRCSFSSSVKSLQWFRRDPGGRVLRLLVRASGTAALKEIMHERFPLVASVRVSKIQKQMPEKPLCFGERKRYPGNRCSSPGWRLQVLTGNNEDTTQTFVPGLVAAVALTLVFFGLPEIAVEEKKTEKEEKKKKKGTNRLILSDFSFCTGMSGGEEVAQHPSFQSVQEGDSFAINCTYTDSASTYFSWYKQEPGKGLQLLMHSLSNAEQKTEQRLTVLLDKKDKHLSLHITATHSGDSATYFCAVRAQWSPGTCSLEPNLRLGLKPHSFFSAKWVSSQKVEETPQSLSIQEGKKAVLSCNYTNFSPENLQWYQQDLGRGLVFLLLIHENMGEKQTGRLGVTFDATIKQSSFYIPASQPADSATCLCAAYTQQGPAIGSLPPNPANHSQATELPA